MAPRLHSACGMCSATLGTRIQVICGLGLCMAAGVGAAWAEAMDLANPTPRWVSVRFEVSPRGDPGRIDLVYARPLRAWLEPEPREGRIELTVAGSAIERLLSAYAPVPGSFTDFVWSFDARTGHVLSATVSGRVVRVLDWGLGSLRVHADVRFRMDTLRTVGFRPERRVFGERMNPFCGADALDGCTPVPPRPYDRATGYVNAVGSVDVTAPAMRFRTFSTLGEARFSERPPTPTDLAAQRAPAARLPSPRAWLERPMAPASAFGPTP